MFSADVDFGGYLATHHLISLGHVNIGILVSEFALHGARIVVRAGALADAAALVRECAPGCRPIVISDANVAPLHAAPIAAAMLGMAVGIGLLTAREVFRETPMAALREA